VERLLRGILTVLWLPALVSDKLFHLASAPFHSADDAVANIVAYVEETFATSFVVAALVIGLRSRAAGLRSRIASQKKTTNVTPAR